VAESPLSVALCIVQFERMCETGGSDVQQSDDHEEKPTVELRVEVAGRSRFDRGRWELAGPQFPSALDYLYNGVELARALRVYGAVVARLLDRDEANSFRVLATSTLTGEPVGVCEWQVSRETGQWWAAEAPMVLWGPRDMCTAA